jgi:hypothetical protein
MADIQIVHQRLVDQSEQLQDAHTLDDMTREEVECIFARSLFLTMRIASSVVGDDKVLDTAGCRTLELYEADFLADEATQRSLEAALGKTISLSPERLVEIERSVQSDVAQAMIKHRVVRAIRDRFGLWDEAGEQLKSNVHRFFEAIYPDAGVVADELDLIVTGTMIFFCLPFCKDELMTDRFKHLSPEAQQPIREFLKRVNRFSQYQFAHFPVFGFRRGSDLPDELLSDLAAAAELTVEQVASELSTLTAVIPTDELDKYVVHDVWGHSWQACMLGFDHLYDQLATYSGLLDLNESARAVANDETLRFEDCFQGQGDSLHFDAEVFERFANLEIAERLPVAMTPVLAEVLADVAEYKLVSQAITPEMANSSALKKFPAKLDLTLRDVLYYFRQATKVFRLWATRSKRQAKTVEQLVQRGASLAAAQAAVNDATEFWRSLEAAWMAPEMQFAEDGDQVHVNVVSRLVLNFLAIHRETLMTYGRIGEMDTGDLPIKGMRDLLLICVAVFFEDSPSRNLWRVDEFLSLKIEPLCRELVANG